MKRSPIGAMLALIITTAVQSQTSVQAPDVHSWTPNAGWLNWQGDIDGGAAFSESMASGSIYAANLGWISLGDGSPENGMEYKNDSASDFGVNIDSTSNAEVFLLSGYAYGANIGWISFDLGEALGSGVRPRIEKATGILRGYAWCANTGWLRLDLPEHVVQTGLIDDKSSARQWEHYR